MLSLTRRLSAPFVMPARRIPGFLKREIEVPEEAKTS